MDYVDKLDFWLFEKVQKFSDSTCRFFSLSQFGLTTLPIILSIGVSGAICYLDFERDTLLVPTMILILVFPLLLLWAAIQTKDNNKDEGTLAVFLGYIQDVRIWILISTCAIGFLVIAMMILFPEEGFIATLREADTLVLTPFVYAPLILLAVYLLDCKPPRKPEPKKPQ